MATPIGYAFWEYSSFPYLLGSPFASVENYGRVRLLGFGGGLVKPKFILSIEDGEALRKRLESMQKDYDKAKAELHERHQNLVNRALGEYGIEQG